MPNLLFSKVFAPLSVLAVLALGCGSPNDELSRARQEIDTRQYQSAIQRLERLGLENPELASSDEYVDLLSSAYLGGSGVDLIDALGHLAENSENLETSWSQLSHAARKKNEDREAIPFEEYKSFIQQLIPPGLTLSETPNLHKALHLCSNRLHAASQESTGISRRILVKTVFVNFWALLRELDHTLIPSAERFLSSDVDPIAACSGLKGTRNSYKRVMSYKLNIELAIALLGEGGDEKLEGIYRLSEKASSLGWIEGYSSCEKLKKNEIRKIRSRFAGK